MDVSSDYKVADTLSTAVGVVKTPTNTMIGATGLIGGAYVNPAYAAPTRGIMISSDDPNYGHIREALTNAAACAFSAWVHNTGGTACTNGTSVSRNYGHIFCQSRYLYGGIGRFELCLEGNAKMMTIRDMGGETCNRSCSDLSAGWHLVTLVYAAGKRRIYIDGVENANLTADVVGYVPLLDRPMRIGMNGDGTEASWGSFDGQWVGGIDEVRFRAADTGTDWMQAEVANVNSAAFVTAGPVGPAKPRRGFVISVH